MSNKKRQSISKTLVVDANILKGAGPKHSVHPTSQACRKTLNAILKICHKVTVTPEIAAEWDKHEGDFAKAWRGWMALKGKVVNKTSFPSKKLTNKIAKSLEKDEIAVLEKDMRLLEAALHADYIVISLDDRTKRKLDRAVAVDALKKVCWENPAVDLDETIQWLERGAKYDRNRCIYPN